MYCGEVHYMTL